MNWAHIVITGICSLNEKSVTTKEHFPCMERATGVIGPHCLAGDETEKKCSRLSWCEAENIVVMTDENGFDCECANYSPDE